MMLKEIGKSGFSILEVTIAIGLLSVGSIGLITLSNNQLNSQKRAMTSQNLRATADALRLILADTYGCSLNFGAAPIVSTSSGGPSGSVGPAPGYANPTGFALTGFTPGTAPSSTPTNFLVPVSNPSNIFPKVLNASGNWVSRSTSIFQLNTLGGYSSDFSNSDIAVSKIYFNNFIGTDSGANSTYYANLVLELDKVSFNSAFNLKTSDPQGLFEQNIQLKLVIDETQSPPVITSCSGTGRSYSNPPPTVTMDNCYQDPDAVYNIKTYCPAPQVLVDLYTQSTEVSYHTGVDSYVRCCTPTVHNLPMQDGTILNPSPGPGFPLAGATPPVPSTSLDSVSNPARALRQCIDLGECSPDGNTPEPCCATNGDTRVNFENLISINPNYPGSVLAISSVVNKTTSGSWSSNTYFQQARLALPQGADRSYSLVLQNCRQPDTNPGTGDQGGDASNITGWMGNQNYDPTYTFPSNPHNQVIVEMMQTRQWCDGECYPIFCQLGIQGP